MLVLLSRMLLNVPDDSNRRWLELPTRVGRLTGVTAAAVVAATLSDPMDPTLEKDTIRLGSVGRRRMVWAGDPTAAKALDPVDKLADTSPLLCWLSRLLTLVTGNADSTEAPGSPFVLLYVETTVGGLTVVTAE
jgi:hypothetical protein